MCISGNSDVDAIRTWSETAVKVSVSVDSSATSLEVADIRVENESRGYAELIDAFLQDGTDRVLGGRPWDSRVAPFRVQVKGPSANDVSHLRGAI